MLSYSNWSNRFTTLLVCVTSLHRRRCISTSRSKMPRILCVAEKPSISKAVAGHLSGGQLQMVGMLARLVRTAMLTVLA